MKLFFIFSLFFSISAVATPAADIVCTNSENTVNFAINTKSGKVWYNDVYEVNGPVFSGVYSPKNYSGEILGEIDLNGASFYLTLIMRNVQGKAQLEAIWYPKNNQNKSARYFLNNCAI